MKFSSIRELSLLFQKKFSKGLYEWVNSGAEDDVTMKRNIEYLNKLQLYPEILKKRKNLNFTKNFFGEDITSPLILSPMGHQTQFHKDGEIEMCKGVDNYGSISFFSTQSRIKLEDVRAKNKNASLVYQIFLFGNKDWIKAEIRRAEKNNCLALAICVDASIRSFRYSDRESGYDARKFGRRTLKEPPDPSQDLSYDWKIISWIKKNTSLPLIVKGLINTKDVKKSINLGVEGIWISNHGGRMFNSNISSIEALMDIKSIIKNKNIVVISDSGVRRGSDIIKFLCLGSDFVGIGRPAIWGLGLDGNRGVTNVFNHLHEELYVASINGGFSSLKDYHYNRVRISN